MTSHECRDLLEAVKRNDLGLVMEFLNRGELLNQRNSNGETVLHLAARGGSKQIVKLLLEWGADVNAVNDAGWSPLHSAVYIGHCTVAEMLIEKNPSLVNVKDSYGTTPLHQATHSKCGTGILELLIAKGAPVNDRDATGKTPLDYALYMKREEFAAVLRSHGGEESGSAWRFPLR